MNYFGSVEILLFLSGIEFLGTLRNIPFVLGCGDWVSSCLGFIDWLSFCVVSAGFSLLVQCGGRF